MPKPVSAPTREMHQHEGEPAPQCFPDIACACATVRRAARVVTQLYGEELHTSGLEATQFSLLSVLNSQSACSQAALGRVLALDKTTLSRNLRLLNRKGWIEPAPAPNPRARGFRLTPAGRELVTAAQPAWKRAQERLRSAMTAREWDAMWKAFRVVTKAAHNAQTSGESR